MSKRLAELKSKVEAGKRYGLQDGVALVVDAARAKFDETVDAALRLGVNPAHADQMVRGSVVLPHGLGKSVRVLVIAKGEKEREALEAGADFVGADDLIEKIKAGWLDFDRMV